MKRAALSLPLVLLMVAGGCSKTSARETCRKAAGSKTTEDLIRRVGQADRIENLSAPLKAWRYAGDDGHCIVMFDGAKVQSVDFIAAN